MQYSPYSTERGWNFTEKCAIIFPKRARDSLFRKKNGEKYSRRAEEQLFDLARDRTSARTKVIVRAFLTVAVVLVLNTEMFFFPKCKKSFVPRISLIKGGAYVEKASAKHPHCGATSWCKSRLRSFRRYPRKTSKRSATTMIFTKKGIRLRGNGNTIGGETC